MGALVDVSDDGLAREIAQVMVPAGAGPASQQRDEQERQEPGDVEVEPVLDRELERDQDRRARAAIVTRSRRFGTKATSERERDRRRP